MKVKNKQVVILSIIAIGCIVALFVFKEWLFIIPAVIIMIINQKKLLKQNNTNKKPSKSK